MSRSDAITVDGLDGDLVVPDGARGVVLFAHGSGSSRHSPRNQAVAGALQRAGLATLLIDLLHPEEDTDRAARFDIMLLVERLDAALTWLRGHHQDLEVGLFGASTGAAAALGVAARRPDDVAAVVSRGGRPDLTPPGLLPAVRAPTLLIVGGRDEQVIAMNRAAQAAMTIDAPLEIVGGATHLFEEPGALERVAELATAWFARLDARAP